MFNESLMNYSRNKIYAIKETVPCSTWGVIIIFIKTWCPKDYRLPKQVNKDVFQRKKSWWIEQIFYRNLIFNKTYDSSMIFLILSEICDVRWLFSPFHPYIKQLSIFSSSDTLLILPSCLYDLVIWRCSVKKMFLKVH